MHTTIKGDGFVVTVIKSNRHKTAALKIKDQEVSIHIPSRLPIKFAHEFVVQKTAWIQQKLKEQSHKVSVEMQFTEGEKHLFLGKNYTLRIIQTEKSPSIIKTPQSIEIHGRQSKLSKTVIRTTLIRWYKQQAEHYLISRTTSLAREVSLTPHSITVKTYKARWGSCGIKGDLQYNWKLMLAPPDIIDYVIIHELCHIKHHNHSPQFWQLVGQHSPRFKSSRLWLKTHGHTLNIL